MFLFICFAFSDIFVNIYNKIIKLPNTEPGYRATRALVRFRATCAFFYCLKTNPGLTGSNAKTAARVVVELDGK